MLQSDIEAVQQPIPNMEMLDTILDLIDEHPEMWEQSSWADLAYDASNNICGTTACIAGHAVALSGYKILYDDGNFLLPIGEAGAYSRDYWDEDDERIPAGMTFGDWQMKARLILGLTFLETDLFDSENTRQDIGVMVERIRYRAKQQAAAFDRIAEELIASVPELEAVLKPGFLCPESQEIVLQYLKGNQDR